MRQPAPCQAVMGLLEIGKDGPDAVIGLDTNVVVRYLTQGDPKQSPIATRLMEKTVSSDETGFISLVVLAEVIWVLVASRDHPYWPMCAGTPRVEPVRSSSIG